MGTSSSKSNNSLAKGITTFAILGLALWLGYPQPSLNFEEDILPLAQAYASTSSSTTPLEGVRVVITGATSGIGLGLVKNFATLGASVIALGRSPQKLKTLQEDIGESSLIPVECQLGDLQSVQQAANEIINQFESIDILINNAGIHYVGQIGSNQSGPPTTPQQLDMSFGVNYVSHFLLTEKLLPLLQKSTHTPTVVQVSSSFHWAADGSELVTTDQQTTPLAAVPGYFQGVFGSQRAYANSKLAQIWHARALQRRYKDVSFKSICPCWVGTNIGGSWNGLILRQTAFALDGFGVKSSLTAALNATAISNQDYYTNSPMTQIADRILPKAFFANAWVYSWYLRDVFFHNFAPLLLVLQKFGASVEPRPSSPESYQEVEQENLYQWSYNTVKEFL